MSSSGHIHPRKTSAPLGFVFLSLIDLGSGPIEAFGRICYKADGNNGTQNLLGKFPRMTNSPKTTGGADSHTLTVDEIPSHDHGSDIGDATGFMVYDTVSPNYQMYGSANVNMDVISTTNVRGGGQAHENRPAFIELIPYEAVE